MYVMGDIVVPNYNGYVQQPKSTHLNEINGKGSDTEIRDPAIIGGEHKYQLENCILHMINVEHVAAVLAGWQEKLHSAVTSSKNVDFHMVKLPFPWKCTAFQTHSRSNISSMYVSISYLYYIYSGMEMFIHSRSLGSLYSRLTNYHSR
jgi:hypothetical protein